MWQPWETVNRHDEIRGPLGPKTVAEAWKPSNVKMRRLNLIQVE